MQFIYLSFRSSFSMEKWGKKKICLKNKINQYYTHLDFLRKEKCSMQLTRLKMKG